MGQKLIDEVGNKYGSLTVLSLTKDKNNRTAWLCQCDCGNTKIVRGSDLRTGRITTCGTKGAICKQNKSINFIDRTNQKYGKLLVLYRSGTSNSGKVIWHCHCECGNECDVIGSDLASGQTQSCGCLRSQGELKIKQWLNKNHISFKTEYSFKDLYVITNRCPLRFDFAIFKSDILIGLVEYQGEQHFTQCSNLVD